MMDLTPRGCSAGLNTDPGVIHSHTYHICHTYNPTIGIVMGLGMVVVLCSLVSGPDVLVLWLARQEPEGLPRFAAWVVGKVEDPSTIICRLICRVVSAVAIVLYLVIHTMWHVGKT
ncbi:hypothetical protein F5Y04DRAFT_264659 [Hypomontagnella monticulosa]|nr:hypothetical protein F5Y04DRAFT_264659 [Hypomontagnella monticulosa]